MYNRIMVATDIHGSSDIGKKLVEIMNTEGAEALVVMGDFYYHGPRNPLPQGHGPMALCETFNAIKDKIIAIRGNCDAHIDEMISEFDFSDYKSVVVGGKSVTFTHGHLYNESKFPDATTNLMFGHTHVNVVYDNGDKIAINLASCSLPKNMCPPSYAIIECGKVTLKDLYGNILNIIDLK